MPRTSSPRGLDGLLDKQLSVATRRQLLTLGLTDRAVQYRVRPGGPWQVLLPGIYLGVNGPPSMKQKEMAALLYGGPGSVITGPAALMHYSIRSGAPLDAIDVLIPAERQRRDAGFVRLQRTARMPPKIAWAGPVRLVLAPRAVADAARRLTTLRDVRAVVADAVQVGRCTIGQLAAELNEGPVRGSAMFRSVLAEVAEGIRSTAEGDLRDLIRVNRLPVPMFNPSLYEDETFLGKPDAWWPDAGVTAEVDSREWHLSPEDWDRTRRRHDMMAAAGIIPLHFSPNQIRREPAEVVRMIKHALDHGRQRSPLPIRTVPCPESSASTAAPPLARPEAPAGARPEAPSGARPEAPSGARPEAPSAAHGCNNVHNRVYRLLQPYILTRPPAGAYGRNVGICEQVAREWLPFAAWAGETRGWGDAGLGRRGAGETRGWGDAGLGRRGAGEARGWAGELAVGEGEGHFLDG